LRESAIFALTGLLMSCQLRTQKGKGGVKVIQLDMPLPEKRGMFQLTNREWGCGHTMFSPDESKIAERPIVLAYYYGFYGDRSHGDWSQSRFTPELGPYRSGNRSVISGNPQCLCKARHIDPRAELESPV